MKDNIYILTPKVTSPGPLAFGLKPSTLSFSVGSDLHKPIEIVTKTEQKKVTQGTSRPTRGVEGG